MEREFTEEKYKEIKQYLPEKNDDLISDLSILNTSLLEKSIINNCLNDTGIYYYTIFDHYHNTAVGLRTIFNSCRELDDTYGTMMQDYLDRIIIFTQYIDKMADVMSKKPDYLSPSKVRSQFIELNKKHQHYEEASMDGGNKKSENTHSRDNGDSIRQIQTYDTAKSLKESIDIQMTKNPQIYSDKNGLMLVKAK